MFIKFLIFLAMLKSVVPLEEKFTIKDLGPAKSNYDFLSRYNCGDGYHQGLFIDLNSKKPNTITAKSEYCIDAWCTGKAVTETNFFIDKKNDQVLFDKFCKNFDITSLSIPIELKCFKQKQLFSEMIKKFQQKCDTPKNDVNACSTTEFIMTVKQFANLLLKQPVSQDSYKVTPMLDFNENNKKVTVSKWSFITHVKDDAAANDLKEFILPNFGKKGEPDVDQVLNYLPEFYKKHPLETTPQYTLKFRFDEPK